MKGNLNRDIGTLISFVNTLGAEERPKRRHRNLYRLPLHWNFTYFWEPLAYFTSILHIKSLGIINSFNKKKPFHFEMIIRNWFVQVCEIDYWTVPPTSYPTKNSELKNWFSIFSVIFMAPLLSISWISWSTNFVSSFDITIGLGGLPVFGWEVKGMVYPCTITNINGLVSSFLQFLRRYFNLLALTISAGNKVVSNGWMRLNSAGNRKCEMLSNGVSGNIINFSWQSWWLASLCERASPPVFSGSKQGNSLKWLLLAFFGELDVIVVGSTYQKII